MNTRAEFWKIKLFVSFYIQVDHMCVWEAVSRWELVLIKLLIISVMRRELKLC